jgi:hypothetical protein
VPIIQGVFKPAFLILKRRQKTEIFMSPGSEVDTQGSVKPLSFLRKQNRPRIILKFDAILDVVSTL